MIKPYYHDEQYGITIYHSDYRDILPHLEPVDLVLTDPPYGIGVQYKNCVVTRKDNRSNEYIAWDENPPTSECFEEINKISKEQIIWGANYFNRFNGQGGAIVWDKLQPLPDSSQCEIASYSKLKKVFKYTQRWTNFVNTKETSHPTEKPVELMIFCIKISNANTILDPFMGSGTTLVAAQQLGRKAIGIEICEDYCRIAVERLKQNCFDFSSGSNPREASYHEKPSPSLDGRNHTTQLSLIDDGHQKD